VSKPSLEEVEGRMRPGRYSQVGFLGLHESLRDVLAADAHAMALLGLSHAQLAAPLRDLLAAALAKRSRTSRSDGYVVRVRAHRGPQICPFAADPHASPCTPGAYRFASIDWDIRDARSGCHLKGPGLLVHLIEAHGFFEGLESPCRVSPAALATLLRLHEAPGAQDDGLRD